MPERMLSENLCFCIQRVTWAEEGNSDRYVDHEERAFFRSSRIEYIYVEYINAEEKF